MNGKNLLLRMMRFFECWTHVISQQPFNFGVRRTCGIEGISFICHQTTYNHVIRQLCDFVCYGPISQATTLPSLVATSLAEAEI